MMKKKYFLIFTLIFTFIFQSFAFAGSVTIKEVKGFDITVGFSEKENETTFDTSRAITGYAPKDTVVTIKVFVPNPKYDVNNAESSKYIEKQSYTHTVSSLGFFNQSIKLAMGENLIEVIAEKGDEISNRTYTINRKSIDIKIELEEKSIILPGEAGK